MLTKLKLFQEPLDILSSGIHLATDCRFMSCWRNHFQPILHCGLFVRPVKTTFNSTFVALILLTMLLASGCEKKTAATDPTAQSTPGSTKVLEAADLVGYDGKRLRKSVDRIKDANERHNRELEKMADGGPDQ